MAVKGRFEGKPWIEWAEDIRLRWQPAMDYYRRELYFEVEYNKYPEKPEAKNLPRQAEP